ncbi:MAG: MotA/TolQ/ExbB proton channel family protein [Candidatus Rokubacteria bacterium]|nr:MotA/TolQ/ExbB proton channel family protein [Candidatus Rokubacteria bacterium]
MPTNGGLTTGVLDLILNAGPVAKFVLVVLALFSIGCWALIIEKWWEFRRIRLETVRFMRAFREGRRFSIVYGASRKHRESPLAQLYASAYLEVAGTSPLSEMVDQLLDDAEEGLAPERLEAANRAMRRCASGEISRMERYLPFLATTASAAPFIGLFGTVWGIMESFRGIGQQGSASLAVVAPGISEALIATAAGLGAAIPAVMAYNYFVNRVKHWAAEMEGFTLDLLNLFYRPAGKVSRPTKDGL